MLPHPVMNPLFIGLIVAILQTLCLHCRRLRISPWYILCMWPNGRGVNGGARRLQRLKVIANACSRQMHCQFCNGSLLVFKQQGLCITARIATSSQTTTSGPGVIVPPNTIFATLMCLPEDDLVALGFTAANRNNNHPANAVLSILPVLPPVSRPAMRTINLKTGQPFVIEDSITIEYQTILTTATAIRNTNEQSVLRQKYIELHMAIERLMLDQGKGYIEASAALSDNTRTTTPLRLTTPSNTMHHSVSIRNRWVGKSGRIRREGMGKRVNF
jgi:DNA-directed RNA polymerase beta' subunit